MHGDFYTGSPQLLATFSLTLQYEISLTQLVIVGPENHWISTTCINPTRLHT